MSPIQDIVTFAIREYLKHYSTPEQSTLLTTDASLATKSAKDAMVEVLDHLQSLVIEEMTRQSTQLKRRRNQEHAPIYQLPHEVFAEITLAATSFESKITDAFTLMRVSKYWFDTVAQSPHIWSPFNVATRPQPGMMTMMRALRGPVEVQCSSEPNDGLDDALAHLSTLDHTRVQALVWYWSSRTEALHSFFLEKHSNIVDLAADRLTSYSLQRELDLPPEGPCLRHLDLRRVTLPWMSPRLSQLRALSIQELGYDQPSIHDLYRILTSSPTLRRIRIKQFNGTNLEQLDDSPAITEPIFLPELHSLELDWLPSTMINTLVPLIRSPSCQYLKVRAQPWLPISQLRVAIQQSREPVYRLEPSDSISDLIISPITSQSTLSITVEDGTSEFSVSLVSSHQPRRNTWGDWDDPNNGISIELYPSTLESLVSLLEGLLSRLQAAGWKPKGLELYLYVSENTSELATQTIQPLLLNFPLTFQTITRLDLSLPTSTACCSALRLLEDEIPELTSLVLYTPVPSGRDEVTNRIKSFLERRYPLHLQGDLCVRRMFSRLEMIYVERDMAECLRGGWPATSLTVEVLSDVDDLS